MTNTTIAKSACPFCGTVQNQALTADGSGEHVPENGDVSLCIDCGEWVQFEDGKLTIPSDEAYDFIASSEHCHRARYIWLRLKEADQAGAESP